MKQGLLLMTEEANDLKKTKLNASIVRSDSPGMVGLFETFMRKFKTLAFTTLLTPVLALCIIAMGLAASPAIYFLKWVYQKTLLWPEVAHFIALGIGLFTAYLIYGISLCFIAPAINFLLPLRLKPWRGIWFSVQSVPWFFHNALTYIVRYTFLEMITPSPMNVLFYRMMGMKIGQGVVINSTNISDPCLIELGDYVTIGGSAHLMAHYGQKGILILSKVKIGDYSTIGLKASVMGGVTVGKKCMIRPHAVLLPRTVVADGESV